MIDRNNYIEKIRPFYHDKKIKIIKGVRRVGKSTLINQIISELKKEKIDNNHIILINFDMFENYKYTNSALLTYYLKSFIKDKNMYYIFLDEVQSIKDWSKIVSFFSLGYNVSIFVTGSSNNLDTYNVDKILDNYICINLYPYSFKESYNEKKDKYKSFNDYITWGGMPPIIKENNTYTKNINIIDIYNSILVKDIIDRYNIKDISLFNRMILYILENIEEPFSVNNMSKFFETYDRKVSLDTMYNYLDYISSCGLFNKIDRLDVNNNKILSGKYKFYLNDFSFYNLISNKQINKIHLYENVICNELLRRGYNVNIAVVGKKDFNFIAVKENEKIYIEVLESIKDDNIRKEEMKKYKSIKDKSVKYILTMDDNTYDMQDIIHKNIIEFLLEN